jgi:hypothetical protein
VTGGPVEVPPALGTFPSSQSCNECHKGIYADWATSMHAHAITSPITLAQVNQLFGIELGKENAPDPAFFCVNCHAPIANSFAQQGTLPLNNPDYDLDAQKEGVGCTSCHSYNGSPEVGIGAESRMWGDFDPSGIFFGPIDNPTTTQAHLSASSNVMKTPEVICINCHNVQADRDNDGLIVPGKDLILQSTSAEFDDYFNKGGNDTCTTCHMPKKGNGKAADAGKESALAPTRTLHDHSFVGVDYPLEELPDNDPKRSAREQLLRSGVTFNVQNIALVNNGTQVNFTASIQNSNTGHNLPTGLAFARQMWIEVVIKDSDGRELAESGRLISPTDDLCDNDTLNDALAFNVKGCGDKAAPFLANGADPQLVNFQQKLVDLIADGGGVAVQDPNGREATLQFLDGGAVPRKRPSDGQTLNTIPFQDIRSFNYSLEIAPQNDQISVKVRLLYRNLPPYFVRTLANNSAGGSSELLRELQFVQTVELDSQFQLLNP